MLCVLGQPITAGRAGRLVASTVNTTCLPVGAVMLMAYQTQYDKMPTLEHCEEIIRLCIKRMADDSLSTDCQEAVWDLLQQMHPPALPQPTIDTFTLATQSVIASLHGDDPTPAHHAFVLLQQHVWKRMHTVLGSGADTLSAYAPSVDVLNEAAETVHFVLLMAQNGVAGIDSNTCLALECNVLDEQAEQKLWMQLIFGAHFVDEVQEAARAAVLPEQDSAELDIAVGFPKHELPTLSVFQLRDGTAVFILEGLDTPWWMRPSAAWGDPEYQHEIDTKAAGSEPHQDPDPVQKQSSAAELLRAQYGDTHVGSRKRGGK